MTITVGDYPGPRTLAWQTDARTTITETEALNLYDGGWRHLNQDDLADHEKAFIQHLPDGQFALLRDVTDAYVVRRTRGGAGPT